MENEEILMVARTVEEIERIKTYLQNPDFQYVAFDTETTGLEKDCEMVGYSVAAEDKIGIYVVLAEWDAQNRELDCEICFGVGTIDKGLKKDGRPKKRPPCKTCKATGKVMHQDGELVRHDELKEASRSLFEILKTKNLIMHNSPFDIRVVRSEMDIDLMPALHTDTMELWHVLDENESAGLKEIASRLYGDDATEEKNLMKASVLANGGRWEESKKPGSKKEMHKADSELFGRYGAKDTILTLKLFYDGIPELFDQGLDKFFFEEESMPLMKTATYSLNSTGVKVDMQRLKVLKAEMTDNCTRLKREIEELIAPYTKDKYPAGFGIKKDQFNIGSSQQLAWLLFHRQGEVFLSLTKTGKALAKDLLGKVPYEHRAKRAFVAEVEAYGKDPWRMMQCDSAALEEYAKKYQWCAKMLDFRGELKLLKTYVEGIEMRMQYGCIYPGFLQHGTTSGRYSSSNPNFQNLPKNDKRVKSMIVARPGRVFIGADYSQLEPRVFASVSQDPDLMGCFAKGQDFYSVVGAPIFGKEECSLFKKDKDSFAVLYEDLRDISKAFALATPYGTSAFQQAQKLKLPQKECQSIIDRYLTRYASVYAMMLESYAMVKDNGVVYSLYGRPRRIPDGLNIRRIYGDLEHGELPYEARTLLNLGMNHRVQSSAASIVNRSAIAFCRRMDELGLDAKIVLQVHDEINVECREEDKDIVAYELKKAMEDTCVLPGVALIAEPKIAYNLADLK